MRELEPINSLLDLLGGDAYAKFAFGTAIKAARKALESLPDAKPFPHAEAIGMASDLLALLKEASGSKPSKSPAKAPEKAVGVPPAAVEAKPKDDAKGGPGKA